MKPFSLLENIAAVILLSACAAFPLRADNMYVWAEETGGDVVFSFQGSIDLTGFPANTNGFLGRSIYPSIGAFASGRASPVAVDIYSVLPGGAERSFGSGADSTPDGETGDFFGITGTLALPPGYTSGTPLAGTMTFVGATFAALGVDPTAKSFDTTVGTNTFFLFTMPPDLPTTVPAVADARADLQIRKLQKRMRKAARMGKKAVAKKLRKKIATLRRKLRNLG